MPFSAGLRHLKTAGSGRGREDTAKIAMLKIRIVKTSEQSSGSGNYRQRPRLTSYIFRPVSSAARAPLNTGRGRHPAIRPHPQILPLRRTIPKHQDGVECRGRRSDRRCATHKCMRLAHAWSEIWDSVVVAVQNHARGCELGPCEDARHAQVPSSRVVKDASGATGWGNG